MVIFLSVKSWNNRTSLKSSHPHAVLASLAVLAVFNVFAVLEGPVLGVPVLVVRAVVVGNIVV